MRSGATETSPIIYIDVAATIIIFALRNIQRQMVYTLQYSRARLEFIIYTIDFQKLFLVFKFTRLVLLSDPSIGRARIIVKNPV